MLEDLFFGGKSLLVFYLAYVERQYSSSNLRASLCPLPFSSMHMQISEEKDSRILLYTSPFHLRALQKMHRILRSGTVGTGGVLRSC